MIKLEKNIQILLGLYKSKKLSKAEKLNKDLIRAHPNVIFLYNILGLVLSEQKKIDEAIGYYEKGLSVQPDYAMIHNNLGSIYSSRNNYKLAETYYKKSIYLDNKIPEPQNNLGNLYVKLNKYEEAIQCFKRAIAINSKFFASHYNLGTLYKNTGKFDEAKVHLKEAINLNMQFYPAHRILSLLNKYTIFDKHFFLLKKIYNNKKIKSIKKTEVIFALAKAYDDIKNFKNAAKFYNEANALRKKTIPFSFIKEKKEFNLIKKIFNKKFIQRNSQFNSTETAPIFILGMPRSGTTLIEQILSSHSKVFGGDELNFIPDLINKYFKKYSDINNINTDLSKTIRDEYIYKLKNLSADKKKIITDKLPINFKWIGFIRLILPNAKIIHCSRDPKDNCLSIFKNYFTNTKLNFAYDTKDITNFYKLYIDLMKHWKYSIPNLIFDLEYEKLIYNPKKQIQLLLKYCNLNWEDKCLKFYENDRLIKTASDIQARKKIYVTSIGSWKNYQNYFKVFFKKL